MSKRSLDMNYAFGAYTKEFTKQWVLDVKKKGPSTSEQLTQRDGMGREEGGGFRMGNTCIPVADSFRYMAKPIQFCKVKK